MSGKRITINKILSNESLSQENQYFQVREQGWRGHAQGRLCECAHARVRAWGRGRADLMEKGQGLGAPGPEGPPQALMDLLAVLFLHLGDRGSGLKALRGRGETWETWKSSMG